MEGHVRTLVLPPSGLADLLFTLPTLEALVAAGRLPRGAGILLHEPLHSLAPLIPGAPRSLPRSPRLSETLQSLTEPDFEEAWLLTEEWLPRVLAARAGIPRRIGYGGLLSSLLLTYPVPRPLRRKRASRHRSEAFRELLEAMGIAPPGSWTPRLEISEGLRRKGLDRLRRAHVMPEEEFLVGLIPGGDDLNQRWPWRRYATLAQTLRRERPVVRFILLAASTDDLWPSVRVHEETARRNPLVGPDLDLSELAGVMCHLRFVVGADGDVLHLAAASGAPTVALFGPTNPERRRPRGKAHQILQAPTGSLRRLAVEPVLEACRTFLS